mmetsp:Transcript_10962/g.18332  ORF Transcript_10962/g.18332 Transcript_10962/m.18332 type:complete len:256 (-) Transcript_10962:220-987(-)
MSICFIFTVAPLFMRGQSLLLPLSRLLLPLLALLVHVLGLSSARAIIISLVRRLLILLPTFALGPLVRLGLALLKLLVLRVAEVIGVHVGVLASGEVHEVLPVIEYGQFEDVGALLIGLLLAPLLLDQVLVELVLDVLRHVPGLLEHVLELPHHLGVHLGEVHIVRGSLHFQGVRELSLQVGHGPRIHEVVLLSQLHSLLVELVLALHLLLGLHLLHHLGHHCGVLLLDLQHLHQGQLLLVQDIKGYVVLRIHDH